MRRKYWAVICPGKSNVYGPFLNDLECAHFLLQKHCNPNGDTTAKALLGTCDGKTAMRRHVITEMVKP